MRYAGRRDEEDNDQHGDHALSPQFEASDYQGCAPLAVKFTNHSENAAGYSWSFGDGGSSVEEHPSYVFDEPGEYTVQLKITGLDDNEYITTQELNVFITPKAQFEYDQDVALANGQPVNFYNY